MPSMAHAQVIAVVVFLAACAHSETGGADVGDCLTARIGDWTPPTELSSGQQPPPVFRLLEATGSTMFEDGKTLVRPVIEGYGTPSAFWSMPSPDSLIVTWTNGYEGIRLRLTRAGDNWTGTANTMTDNVIVGRTTPTAPAAVEPVACM